jgi:hypothetical protein
MLVVFFPGVLGDLMQVGLVAAELSRRGTATARRAKGQRRQRAANGQGPTFAELKKPALHIPRFLSQ